MGEFTCTDTWDPVDKDLAMGQLKKACHKREGAMMLGIPTTEMSALAGDRRGTLERTNAQALIDKVSCMHLDNTVNLDQVDPGSARTYPCKAPDDQRNSQYA
ncbi:unnamed protein product [Ilex paraguariensis]|uniref:Uncharacterized protein n=1 Tax=Ilex paraguariensis TaxID=185542 RepID=A0ABC8UV26_9AQUA